MRQAHAVSDVRTAEHTLMETGPDGALMQRAAAGLAAICARLLGRVYGSRVVVLAGTGANGRSSSLDFKLVAIVRYSPLETGACITGYSVDVACSLAAPSL